MCNYWGAICCLELTPSRGWVMCVRDQQWQYELSSTCDVFAQLPPLTSLTLMQNMTWTGRPGLYPWNSLVTKHHPCWRSRYQSIMHQSSSVTALMQDTLLSSSKNQERLNDGTHVLGLYDWNEQGKLLVVYKTFHVRSYISYRAEIHRRCESKLLPF